MTLCQNEAEVTFQMDIDHPISRAPFEILTNISNPVTLWWSDIMWVTRKTDFISNSAYNIRNMIQCKKT